MPILPISTCKDVHLICFLYRACLFYGCLKGQKLSMPEMSLHTYLPYNILIIISILFSLLFVAVVGFLLFFFFLSLCSHLVHAHLKSHNLLPNKFLPLPHFHSSSTCTSPKGVGATVDPPTRCPRVDFWSGPLIESIESKNTHKILLDFCARLH